MSDWKKSNTLTRERGKLKASIIELDPDRFYCEVVAVQTRECAGYDLPCGLVKVFNGYVQSEKQAITACNSALDCHQSLA